MRTISTAEFTRMSTLAEESFNDTCDIMVWSGYSDGLSDDLDSWPTTISGVGCGFAYGKEQESERGQIVILEEVSILRLDKDQAISIKDKVDVRDKIYTVDGITEGFTVKVVELKELNLND